MGDNSFFLVDENTVSLKEMADILKYLGHSRIEMFTNASQAWSIMKIRDPRCLISAWEMPEMTGLALLKIVRSSDRFFKLPFFLSHSAYTKPMVIQAGLSGVTGLFVRPFELRNVKSKIESIYKPDRDPVVEDVEEKVKKGNDLLESEKFEEALEIFDDLTKIKENAEYYYNIGYIKTAQGKYSEALQAFKKATELDHLFAKAYESMGRVYQKLGNSDEAEKCLIRAADIHMSKENVDYAEEILREIMEMSPDTINVFNSLGVLYRKKGNHKMAISNYQKALKVHPGNASIHYNIGRLYIDMKDPEKAKSYFSHALQLNPEFNDAKEALRAIEFGVI